MVTLFYSQFIHKLGCLLMTSAGQGTQLLERSVSTSLHSWMPLNPWQEGELWVWQGPTSVLFVVPVLGLSLSFHPPG